MRSSPPLLAAALLAHAAVACQSAPQPKPDPVVAEADEAEGDEAEPIFVSNVAATKQSLRGATLQLAGVVDPALDAKSFAWSATALEETLGEGTVEVSPDADGVFQAELPITFATTRDGLAKFQTEGAVDVLLTLRTTGKEPVEKTFNARIRSPLLPTATVLSVQASREGPQAMAVTYLVSIRNPNPYEIRIGSLKYDVKLAGRSIGKGEVPLASKVPASADNMFEIPALANVESYGKDIAALFKLKSTRWDFSGTVSVGGIDVPLEVGGDMKISAQ